jgi:hypothetical protein
VSHPNARTTFHGRMLIVQRHQAGWRQAHIAAAMGISRRCVKKWIDRHAVHGVAGLRDRSSRPHSSPRRTAPAVEQLVLAARAEFRRGQDWIAAEVGVAARTVGRILHRHHIPHLRLLDPITGQVIKASKATAVRYEHDQPGDLAHMDVKKIGRIPDGGGGGSTAALTPPVTAPPNAATTTSTPSSTTTPAWPTPRSYPTRKAPPAPRSYAAPPPTSTSTASPASTA